jgi:transcriptional regulator GlxA family with amidase domain
LFSDRVGLTPKLFCRLLRFQRARAVADEIAAPAWAQLASLCGYFDQAHLIKDFREFTGLTPAEYVRQRRPGEFLKENHALIPE